MPLTLPERQDIVLLLIKFGIIIISSVWAAVVAPADEIGGRYCENCHVGNVVPDDVTLNVTTEGVRAYALDPGNAEALWKRSEGLVGESF